jgi:hypothetical protein
MPILQPKKMVVFCIKPKRRPRYHQGEIILEDAGYKIMATSIQKHIFRFVPRIATPYGKAPDMHIRHQGNGLFALYRWSTGQPAEENLSEDAAIIALQNYYEDEFRRYPGDEKAYYLSTEEAIDAVAEMISDQQGISHQQARQQYETAYKASIEAREQTLEQNHRLDESRALKQYLNTLPYIPGERFDETKARLEAMIPERTSPVYFYATLRTIRRKWMQEVKSEK